MGKKKQPTHNKLYSMVTFKQKIQKVKESKPNNCISFFKDTQNPDI